MPTTPCLHCQKPFKITRDAKKFCSRRCYHDYRKGPDLLTQILKTESCWIWTGRIHHSGYGKVEINGKPKAAHRAVYEVLVGPIAEGKSLLHKCDNRPCVNPDHMFQGTSQDNTDDMIRKGRAAYQKKRAQKAAAGGAPPNE